MRKTRKVRNLNTEVDFVFNDVTPLEALHKMIYYININHKCDPIINKSESGKTLWFEDRDQIYAVVND